MQVRTPDEIRTVLRSVNHPGFARDIVSAGFVRGVTVSGGAVFLTFAPNSTDAAKVKLMEEGIREALTGAGIADIRIRTTLPFAESDMTLRQPAAAAESDADIVTALTGLGVVTPLEAELREDGIVPQSDMLRDEFVASTARSGEGLGAPAPDPFEGPVASGDSYTGELPVFQWDIDPHDTAAENFETSVRLDDWEIRVWWQAHPTGELLYASLQAMRDDWADHIGSARLHPVGRSAAVNLVFDRRRKAVVAIYGTVRDFRPFVEAFRQALEVAALQTPDAIGEEKVA